MNDNDYEMQVEDLIKAEEIKYEVVLVFPYFSHDSTALCYTEGATQQNTQYRLPAEQWWPIAGPRQPGYRNHRNHITGSCYKDVILSS